MGNLLKKTEDEKCTSDLLSSKCKHQRVPAGSSRSLNPRVAALIAGTDGKNDHKKYPVVFEYNGEAEEVFLSGSFNDWGKLKMSKMEKPVHGMKDFITVLDLQQGIIV